MLNCKESTRLASDRMERRLAVSEQVTFRLHILVCPFCRRFARQIRLMGRLMRHTARLSESELEMIGRKEAVDRERFIRSLKDD
jgi:hypothetical protein